MIGRNMGWLLTCTVPVLFVMIGSWGTAAGHAGFTSAQFVAGLSALAAVLCVNMYCAAEMLYRR